MALGTWELVVFEVVTLCYAILIYPEWGWLREMRLFPLALQLAFLETAGAATRWYVMHREFRGGRAAVTDVGCVAELWGGHSAFLHLLLLRDEAFMEGPSESEGGDDAPEDGGDDELEPDGPGDDGRDDTFETDAPGDVCGESEYETVETEDSEYSYVVD